MTTPSIKTVTPSSADQAVGTVVLAFSADPIARWFYPDPYQYLLHLPSFVRAFAGKAFEHNSAYCVDGYLGAALWLPPDVHSDENALAALLQRTIPEENQPEIFTFTERMNSSHPSEPHWYLPMIGVDPAKQGNGYGSALMKHSLGGAMPRANSPISNRRAQEVSRSTGGTALNCSPQFKLVRHLRCFRCCGNHGDW